MYATSLIDLKQELTAWGSDDRFIDSYHLMDFSMKLSHWLARVRASAKNPEQGLELIKAFFETDMHLMENSDDDGVISMVFEYEGPLLFWEYAGKCADRDLVQRCLLELLPYNLS